MKSEMLKRILIAMIAIPLAAGLSLVGGWPFAILISVMSTISVYELLRLLEKTSLAGIKSFGLPFAFVTPLLVHQFGTDAITPLFMGQIITLGLCSVALGTEKGFRALVATLFATSLIALPMSSMILIHDSRYWNSEFQAGMVLIYVWAGVWVADSAAYFLGRAFGRHKLAPILSPKKTIEGSAANLLGALAWALIAGSYFGDLFNWVDRIAIGLLIGFFSQVGDLVESMVKRAAGVKDSGRLFPGHGGAYDRFDSMMFVSTAVYLYMYLRGF